MNISDNYAKRFLLLFLFLAIILHITWATVSVNAGRELLYKNGDNRIRYQQEGIDMEIPSLHSSWDSHVLYLTGHSESDALMGDLQFLSLQNHWRSSGLSIHSSFYGAKAPGELQIRQESPYFILKDTKGYLFTLGAEALGQEHLKFSYRFAGGKLSADKGNFVLFIGRPVDTYLQSHRFEAGITPGITFGYGRDSFHLGVETSSGIPVGELKAELSSFSLKFHPDEKDRFGVSTSIHHLDLDGEFEYGRTKDDTNLNLLNKKTAGSLKGKISGVSYTIYGSFDYKDFSVEASLTHIRFQDEKLKVLFSLEKRNNIFSPTTIEKTGGHLVFKGYCTVGNLSLYYHPLGNDNQNHFQVAFSKHILIPPVKREDGNFGIDFSQLDLKTILLSGNQLVVTYSF